MNSTKTVRRLLALLVGIDTYQKPVTRLHGCINDVGKIQAALEAQKGYFEVQVSTLVNSEAIKGNIVDQFRTHLGNATADDTVLFYYSGHGTQEEADPVFWFGEPDKKLESLVCYDGIVLEEGKPKVNLLADKELRFLIGEMAAADPHIIVIFDCCHSGTATRNGGFSANDQAVLERKIVNTERMSMAFPQRKWADFIFGETISYVEIQKKGVATCLREGKHIHMAACQNDESAYEVAGEGVFTKNLVEILQRCQGNISYHRLQSTIQGYLRHQFKQTPKIYVTKDDSLLFSGFLNKTIEGGELYATVSFHANMGWILDMGSMQGIEHQKEISLEEYDSGTLYIAKITEVHVSYSQVSILTDSKVNLETTLLFKAKINTALGQSLQIYVTPKLAKHSEGLLLQKIKQLAPLHLVKQPPQADYCLVEEDDYLLLVVPERLNIPLVPKIPLKTLNKEGLNVVLNYLGHLSKFEFVKHLTNPGAFLLRPDYLAIHTYVDDTSIPIKNDMLELDYVKQTGKWGGSIRIKLKNTSDKKLYSALCYLSFNFGIVTRILPMGVVGLEPGAETWALDGAPIDFVLEPEILAFNYSESTSYIKLLLSTEDFTTQLQTLVLDDLPSPITEGKGTRGLKVTAVPEVVHDWTTRLITLRMPNPEL